MCHQQNHGTKKDHRACDKTTLAGDRLCRIRILGRIFFRRTILLQLLMEDEVKVYNDKNQCYNGDETGIFDKIHKGKA